MTAEGTLNDDHSEDLPPWVLTLYVNGTSPRSFVALETVHRICTEDLRGRVQLQVIDVHAQTGDAVPDRIWTLPTLVKRRPPPRRELVGGLEDTDLVRRRLGLGPGPPDSPTPLRSR